MGRELVIFRAILLSGTFPYVTLRSHRGYTRALGLVHDPPAKAAKRYKAVGRFGARAFRCRASLRADLASGVTLQSAYDVENLG